MLLCYLKECIFLNNISFVFGKSVANLVAIATPQPILAVIGQQLTHSVSLSSIDVLVDQMKNMESIAFKILHIFFQPVAAVAFFHVLIYLKLTMNVFLDPARSVIFFLSDFYKN